MFSGKINDQVNDQNINFTDRILDVAQAVPRGAYNVVEGLIDAPRHCWTRRKFNRKKAIINSLAMNNYMMIEQELLLMRSLVIGMSGRQKKFPIKVWVKHF